MRLLTATAGTNSGRGLGVGGYIRAAIGITPSLHFSDVKGGGDCVFPSERRSIKAV